MTLNRMNQPSKSIKIKSFEKNNKIGKLPAWLPRKKKGKMSPIAHIWNQSGVASHGRPLQVTTRPRAVSLLIPEAAAAAASPAAAATAMNNLDLALSPAHVFGTWGPWNARGAHAHQVARPSPPRHVASACRASCPSRQVHRLGTIKNNKGSEKDWTRTISECVQATSLWIYLCL